MKTKMITPFLLVMFLTTFTGVMGQTKSEKEKQAAEEKKKVETTIIIDGKKITEEELLKELEETRKDQEKDLQRMRTERYEIQKEAMDGYKKAMEEVQKKGITGIKVMPRHDSWESGDVIPFDNFSVWNLSENSSLSISKNLEDVTFATDFAYEMKEGNYSISFSVNGTLNSGELKITMKKPDGKTFQELTISPLADVNWNQQFSWDEEDEDEFLGKWTIAIKADKAKGQYRVRVNSR